MITWSEAMSVGVPRLDSDHRVLIGLINHLDRATARRFETRMVVSEVLDALLAYTRFHFEREERVMEACDYPEIDSHRGEHAELTREVEDFIDRFQRDPVAVTHGEMLVFLTEWLNHHILLQDKAYRPFVEGQPKAEDVAERYGHFDFAPFDVDVSEADLEKAG